MPLIPSMQRGLYRTGRSCCPGEEWRKQTEVGMIKGLHHNVYRCRDSEETRVFYEDFLGLRFVSAFEIDGGRGLHTFFEIRDG